MKLHETCCEREPPTWPPCDPYDHMSPEAVHDRETGMKLRLIALTMTLVACASTPTPEPHPEHSAGPTSHAVSAAPVVIAPASVSAEVGPPPAPTTTAVASVPTAASAAPPTSPEPEDVCEDLVKLCHDVGHDGGVTGKCHQVGHARDDKACKSQFSACKIACEAATKAAETGGKKKHAH